MTPSMQAAPVVWDQQEQWKTHVYSGHDCTAMVQVVHWTLGGPDRYSSRGNNHWNVYVFLYPTHPLFAAFAAVDADKYALTEDVPLHGGQTFYERHFDETGATVSVQVGCDYGHYGDDEYSRLATKEEATTVFRDAERLVAWAKAGAQ